MTHAPPNDAFLMVLNTWIDRKITRESLQYTQRIGHLLNTQLIARSIIELQFLSRVLSMYTHDHVSQGLFGTDGVVITGDLEFRDGTIGPGYCFALTTNSGTEVVLRGGCMGTPTAALESFIDTVLIIGQACVTEFTKEHNKKVKHRERETA